MRQFEDYVIDALKRKYASDIFAAMAAQKPVDFDQPRDHINLPLVAEASVLFEKQRPRLLVRAKGWCTNPEGTLGFQQVFSTSKFDNANEAAALVTYLVEQVARMMAERVASGWQSEPR